MFHSVNLIETFVQKDFLSLLYLCKLTCIKFKAFKPSKELVQSQHDVPFFILKGTQYYP